MRSILPSCPPWTRSRTGGWRTCVYTGATPRAYLTGKTVAERFHYDYSEAEIAEVSERARNLAKEADEVHVVFNNNARDFAPVAAERLRRKLGQGGNLPKRPRTQGTLF